MEATIVDLRYHMNDVLKALERNENVRVLYRGKVKGVLRPAIRTAFSKVSEHVFFGSRPAAESVAATMTRIRGGRYHAL